MRINFLALVFIFLITSCAETRIHEEDKIGNIFREHGIGNACFIMRDHTHETIYFYNKERCLKRFTPASTFKIFNALAGLESVTAPDERYVIKWDSVERWNTEWNHDMNMREAFKTSNVGYFQELARRIGRDYLQHYIDTVQYGNKRIGPSLDMFWLNDTLLISADEQLGFIKKLYFDELPFAERSQRIVRSMMLQEETDHYKLYYKTGTSSQKDSTLYWIVGFAEKIERVKEHEKSMNKSNLRNYPYFFAQNFTVKSGDSSQDWFRTRVTVLKEILHSKNVLWEP